MVYYQSSGAIFSPSVARIAASTAKDWNYVDDWLASKFPGRSIPPFERNAETLKTLLSLASLNEASDEDRQLVARSEAASLRELQTTHGSRIPSANTSHTTREPVSALLLDALEDLLPPEGGTSLQAVASLSVELGVAVPTPKTLGLCLVHLQSRLCESEEMQSCVRIQRSYCEADMIDVDRLLQDLQSWKYAPSHDLARHNLDLQRKIRTLTSKLPEVEDRFASLETSSCTSHPLIDSVAQDEARFSALLSRKKSVEARLSNFAGLSEDTGVARDQLEKLRGELQTLAQRRDAIFEGLVERESPRKRP